MTLAVGGAVAFGFMRPDLILQSNTPTGGDMGAHVLIPAYLRDELIPSGRLLGWSNQWYAGFPVLYFYFPLPAVTIVLLDLVFPYGVAFKLVTVAGLVALPFASYYLVRAIGVARPIALVGGIAGGTYVFMESFSIFGGNTLSTLAGEYSFSWSFALAFVYLGMVIRNTRHGRGFTLGTAVVLALTALSHVITTMVIVLASLPLLIRRRGVTNLIGSWGVGFALAGFWAVPLLARMNLTTDMGWFPVRGIDPVLPRELWPMLVLAAGGLLWAVAKRYPVGPLVALMVLPVVGYYLIQFIDFRRLYNARLLPFWYYSVHLFAGIGVGAALAAAARRLRKGETARWVAAAGGAALFLAVAVAGINKTPAWAAWNYSGYEGKRTHTFDAAGRPQLVNDYWEEYQGLMEALVLLPPGRVMWEANRDLNRYGTPMALMLTGYWTEGRHPSMEGLLFESALTTPFHFLNASEVSHRPSNPVTGLTYHRLDFDRAVKHLALYDVAYYVSFTPEATEAATAFGLPVLARPEPFTVFGLPGSSLVDIAEYEPAVWSGSDSFTSAALLWYDDVDSLDRWLVAEGPEEWRRIDNVAEVDRRPLPEGGTVSNVVLENHRIAFDTTAVGVPHLVKVSYFPNWQAVGAEGPYRAAPSLMIVIPTEEHVEIVFADTWAERTGNLLSVGSVVGIGLWALLRRSREGEDDGISGDQG